MLIDPRSLLVGRRSFLKGAAAAASLASGATAASAAPSCARLAVYRTIFDPSHPISAAFGLAAARLGRSMAAIDGDVTRLWYDDLGPRWREQPVAIAGLTTPAAAFCLEGLASDVFMRPLFRGEHRPTPDGWEHRLTGPMAMLRPASSLACADWGAVAARLLASPPAPGGSKASTTVVSAASRTVPPGPGLVSFVLAPRRA